MNNIFKGENILAFIKSFPDDDSCRLAIATEKWKDGFKCVRCGNRKFVPFAKHYTKECTKCRYKESATAGTLFHKVKFDLQKAFCIVFEMTCTTKGLSTTQAAKRYGITQKTSWLFMQKVKLAMKSSGTHPMEGNVHVDELWSAVRKRANKGEAMTVKR